MLWNGVEGFSGFVGKLCVEGVFVMMAACCGRVGRCMGGRLRGGRWRWVLRFALMGAFEMMHACVLRKIR